MSIAAPYKKAVSLFHALSDETRLTIVELLQAGERCVCELTDAHERGTVSTVVSSEGTEGGWPDSGSS
jgi:DNA-binding transcriptional ArsR family regulator